MKQFKIFLIISILFIIACCKERHLQFDIAEEQFEPIVKRALSDTLLPPKVTPISATKGPKKITNVIQKTVPLKHPYGVGVPIVTSFGIADGLTSPVVSDLKIDQQGKLWIGGLGNLSSYDGSTFTNFTSLNSNGNLFVGNLLVDSKNNLWVGAFGGSNHLYKYDGQKFKPINLGFNDAEFVIRTLIEDSEGSIWIGSSQGVYRIAEDSVTKFGIDEGITDLMVFMLLMDKNGNVIANSRRGTFQFDGEKFSPLTFNWENNGSFTYLNLVDSQGNFWGSRRLGGKEIIGKFDKQSFTPVIESDFLRAIYEDSSGKIWIATNDQLITYHQEKLIQYTLKEFGISNAISFAEDQTGNIWIGSLEGLFRLSFSYMNPLEKVTDRDESFFPSILIDAQGVKWEGENQQLIRYNQNEAIVYDLSKFLDPQKLLIASLQADKEGHIWMETNGRPNERILIQFDGVNFYRYDSSIGLELTLGHDISVDNQGNLIIFGTGGYTLFDGNSFTRYGKDQGFPEYITNFLVDKRNQIWVGTDTTGVRVYTQDSVMEISTAQGLPNNYVNVISEDPFGNIWIGTDGGLSKFDGEKLTNFPQTEGFGSIITGIAVDNARELIWFSSSSGLITLPFDQIDEINPKVSRYSQSNGFDLFTGIFSKSTILFDSSGVWTKGLRSIQRLDIDKVMGFPTPSLEIKNIRINNQEVIWSLIAGEGTKDSLTLKNESALKFRKSLDRETVEKQFTNYRSIQFNSLKSGSLIPEKLQLPFRNNSITFQFAANSLSFGKHIQYRYKLDGYEDNWSPWSLKDEAFFGNMSEGEYKFRLEAISPYGAKSELAYDFVVLPPWYRTWWAYLSYSVLFLSCIFGFIRWRTQKLKHEKAILEKEVSNRTSELKQSLEHLKSTQAQLIQSEKMASLGELTAGIAHEIQNPLNFVNNFSEVSEELVDEMKEEIEKGDFEEVKFIANDLKENLSKINHHGKRADAIVKGMLEHSRANKGEKAPTDLNALAEEYVRLSYHGLRAKDKSFNAHFKLELDPNLPKVNVVASDIGRVILNLVNNAFYAVHEKAKSGSESHREEGYKPEVTVSSSKTENGIEISVKDNGNGIPDSIKEKIFQPFFTTKPTGSGTGLGLSLSYDIVKAHGGELRVESSEGEYTTITIILPAK
jgi:signal transduction histidine kinase/ligand-binding sensor domain-containing protein